MVTQSAYLIAAALLIPATAQAAEFWVDPSAAAAGSDGSQNAPWPSVTYLLEQGLIESQEPVNRPYVSGSPLQPKNAGAVVKSGDTVWLTSGNHGRIFVQGYYNSGTISVRAAPGHTPLVSQLWVQASSGWDFRGLSISPTHAAPGTAPTRAQGMVFIQNHDWQGPSRDIFIEGNEIFTTTQTQTQPWDAGTWAASAYDGVISQGTNILISNNVLHDVRFGIQVHGEETTVRGNHIERFTGDGLRAIGSYGIYEDNVIRHALAVDDNHDDGFQAWSLGPNGIPGQGVISNITVRRNRFIHFDPQDTRFRGNFQGIGCFDGFYDNFVIENNLVVVDSWHGITLAGTRDTRITNNTIVSANAASDWVPAIWIRDHKDGRPSARVAIRNNLSTRFNFGTGSIEDHNLTYSNPNDHFVAPQSGDFHLTASSPAIDQGTPQDAPPADLEGRPRPQGAGIDLGAYEWALPVATDAGTDAGTTDAPIEDAQVPDAHTKDAQVQDAGQSDTGQVDAGQADGGTPDAGQADAGTPDLGTIDLQDTNPPLAPVGCACAVSQRTAQGPSYGLVGLLVIGLWTTTRRKTSHAKSSSEC